MPRACCGRDTVGIPTAWWLSRLVLLLIEPAWQALRPSHGWST
jgi:hypothetical protein